MSVPAHESGFPFVRLAHHVWSERCHADGYFAGEADVRGYRFVDAQTTEWRASTFAEGVEVKDLGTSDGTSMQLVRFAPGASFPIHTHAGPEFVYLLEGEAVQNGQCLYAGWAATAATGTVDEHFHSPTGCMFLTVYSDD